MTISQPREYQSFSLTAGQTLQLQGHAGAFLSVKFGFGNSGTLGLYCNGQSLDIIHPDNGGNCMEMQSMKLVCPEEGSMFCTGEVYINEIPESCG